jgi:hypothetical protein
MNLSIILWMIFMFVYIPIGDWLNANFLNHSIGFGILWAIIGIAIVVLLAKRYEVIY